MKNLYSLITGLLLTISLNSFAQNQNPSPIKVVVKASPTVFCAGQTTSTLTATIINSPSAYNQNVTYYWYRKSSGGDIEISFNGPSSLTVNIEGDYYVRVYSQSRNSFSSDVQVSSRPIIQSSSKVICNNSPILLKALISDTASAVTYTYQWTKTGVNIPNATSSTYSATVAGEYSVLVNNGTCIKQSDPYVLTATSSSLSATASIISTNNGKICYGTKTALISNVTPAGNNYIYNWHLKNGAVINDIPEKDMQNKVNPYVELPGKYILRVASLSSGCMIESNEVTLTQPSINTPQPIISTRICDSLIVPANIISINPNYTYTWYERDYEFSINQSKYGKVLENETNDTLIIKSNKDYFTSYLGNNKSYFYSVASDSTGCGIQGAGTKFLSLPFNGSAFSFLTSDGNPIYNNATNNYCAGSSITLKTYITYDVPQGSNTLSYKWTGPDNFQSTLAQPVLTNISDAKTGEYKVEVKSTGGNCNGTLIFKTYVNIKPFVMEMETSDPQWLNQPPTVFCNNSFAQLYLGNKYNHYSSNGYTVSGQWYEPSGIIVGQTGTSLNISNLDNTKTGEYRFVGSITSTGMCAGASVVAKKTVVLATDSTLKLNIATQYIGCNQANVRILSNKSNASSMTISCTRLNLINSTSSNLTIPIITANLGDYTFVVKICGNITLTKTITITAPNDCDLPIVPGSSFSALNEIAKNEKSNNSLNSNSVIIDLPESVNFNVDSPINLQPILTPYYAENSFLWTGPNGFTSTSKKLYFEKAANVHEGVYTLVTTLNSQYTPNQIIKTVIISVDDNYKTNKIIPEVTMTKSVSICEGKNLDLDNIFTVSPQKAIYSAQYLWTGPNGFTSANPFPVFTNIQTNRGGVYTLSVTFTGDYSGSSTSELTINLNPIASITGSNVICPSGTGILNAIIFDNDNTPGKLYSYAWTGPNSFSSTLKIPTISQDGTYNLTITKTKGGCNGTFTSSIIVSLNTGVYSPKALTTQTYRIGGTTGFSSGNYLSGQTFILKAFYPDAVNSYSWIGPNGFVSTASSPIMFSPSQANAGVYTVIANVPVALCEGGTQNVNVSSTISILISGGIEDFLTIGNLPSSWCLNTPLNIPFTTSWNYISGNIFTAQLSNSTGSFSSPTTLGTLTGTTSGTIVVTIPNSVIVGSGYKVRLVSSSPNLSNNPAKFLDITAICQCLNNISLMTGNWGTAGIWSCGHIPLVTEPVQISTGHTITLDVNGAAKSLDLRGILNKQATKVLLIQGN